MTGSNPSWTPAHEAALLRTKRQALHATRAGRMAVPESEDLLARAFAHAEPAVSQAAQLLRLLDPYGVAALRRAVRKRWKRNTPRASSDAFQLRRHHCPAPLPALDPSHHPEAQALEVHPHDLETHDELAHSHDDPGHSLPAQLEQTGLHTLAGEADDFWRGPSNNAGLRVRFWSNWPGPRPPNAPTAVWTGVD